MPRLGHQIRFLASVTSAEEAVIAAAAGADIVDAKDPGEGALGALPADVVRAIRRAVPRRVPVSATIGDVAADPDIWADRARAMAAAGADYVKIGVFPGGDARRAIARVGTLGLGATRLVGVLIADKGPDLGLVERMAQAGFAGAMLDTADKSRRALPEIMDPAMLGAFVAETRRHGMLAGLAGSLGLRHVEALAMLAPDILGFRGALCTGEERTAALDPGRARRVREALAAVREPGPAEQNGSGPEVARLMRTIA